MDISTYISIGACLIAVLMTVLNMIRCDRIDRRADERQERILKEIKAMRDEAKAEGRRADGRAEDIVRRCEELDAKGSGRQAGQNRMLIRAFRALGTKLGADLLDGDTEDTL